MKNKFIIGTLFSIFLLCSSNVKAVNFTDNQTVDANKTWTIKFNGEIQLDDLTKQGVSVTDNRGNAADVSLKLGQDSKSIVVEAPEYGYVGGKSYTLYVGKKVHSIDGNALSDDCTLNFNVKRKFSSGGIVSFKDKNLEQEIRDYIEKESGNIYQSDIEDITELYMNNRQIKDLSGIENLTNLKKLNLGNNKISDVSALSKLTNIQKLNLGYIPYYGFEMPDPEVNYNEISDISALKNFTNLQELNLGYTKIKDINELKALSNLKKLDLSDNQISDISGIVNALKELANLNDLNLSTNEISDISELSKLTNLKMLSLNSNNISNINTLKGLNNLQTLNLGSNQISDISNAANVLKELINLSDLNLSNNQISDIGEFNKLTNLKTLYLNHNKISDISALKGFSNLQMLELSNNAISDVSILKNLTNLKWLALFDDPISNDDIQALKNALPQCEINEVLVKKPNIYLYPEETEELSVNISPNGKITKSIPEYNGGWKVTVDPSGKIDNTYDFLFYEASINYKFTLDKGWIVNKDSFNEEMNSILTSIGLNSKEKADFIEYWSKELNWKSSKYAIYCLDPKEINEAIKLNLSKKPDSILRAYFYFVPLKDNENLEIKKPEIKQFKRNGFTVVEWGGIGK